MSSEDIYTLYNIDKSKLKRDYIKYPLKRGLNQHDTEYFYQEDLIYLYITLNLRLQDLSKIFNLSIKSIRNNLKYYNIKKPSILAHKNTIKYFQENYKVNAPSQVSHILQKQLNTCLKKYGSRSSLWGTNKKFLYKRSSNKSKNEILWLNEIGLPCDNKHRQVLILNYNVDGFDPNTNTVYEYLGDYWHGNIHKYNPTDINQNNHKTFQELYNYTFQRLNNLKNNGYNVIYIWESEFKKGLPYTIL